MFSVIGTYYWRNLTNLRFFSRHYRRTIIGFNWTRYKQITFVWNAQIETIIFAHYEARVRSRLKRNTVQIRFVAPFYFYSKH